MDYLCDGVLCDQETGSDRMIITTDAMPEQSQETKTMKKSLIKIITGVLLLCCLVVGVSADENETEYTPYFMSEQYQTDVDYWYDYYTQERATGYESTLRAELDDLLNSDTLTVQERNDAVLIKMGWDFRLENYMDGEKRTIDEDTGKVTYSLGIANWWANLFGNGIKEETLPQTMAEGDALYKIYCENFEIWVNLLKGDSE